MLTDIPSIKHNIATIAVIVTSVFVLKTDLSIVKVLISIIGPNARNEIIDPREKVEASDNAKKASTEEQIDITKASAINAIILRVGSLEKN